jgi:hypothetical protein
MGVEAVPEIGLCTELGLARGKKELGTSVGTAGKQYRGRWWSLYRQRR